MAKKILIGITGSIAAYKIPILARILIKDGHEVRVTMTPAAKDFVSPLVLSTLTREKVFIDLFDEDTWANHVALGRWADLLLIAPASCNTIAKMANGLCDNFLLATYMSATCPVMIAPAMDEDMWLHPSLNQNILKLKSYGNIVLDTIHGELASGLIGKGRMQEPEDIVNEINHFFASKNLFQNKKIVITAGPTYENIDPVRFIGNYSSGKMGIAIAEALSDQGAEVHLILGPSTVTCKNARVKVTKVRSAVQMYDATTSLFPTMDIAIMSAAVADYTPVHVTDQKIKKADGALQIELTKTKDILKHLGSIKSENQTLVGFALESQNEEAYALKKLSEKNADLIVMNSMNDQGAGFGHDTNKVTLYHKDGTILPYELKSKKEVALDIIAAIHKIHFNL
jgi:phosphopantothenoylcysteine decarboxylase/phosphopantothenate--cysteine ligase